MLPDVWSTLHVLAHTPCDLCMPGKREVLTATHLRVLHITGADLDMSVNIPPGKSSLWLHDLCDVTSDVVLQQVVALDADPLSSFCASSHLLSFC